MIHIDEIKNRGEFKAHVTIDGHDIHAYGDTAREAMENVENKLASLIEQANYELYLVGGLIKKEYK